MKVISTNLGEPTKINWNGKQTLTGIYKYPVDQPIYLDTEDVQGDTVVDRKYHGGIYKACYLFSADHYDYWKAKYPQLEWDWGMFGENLTIQGLDESQLRIGSTYRLGTALVQISQPREPCYKLGIRFGDQEILKQFIDHGRPGTYIRVLEPGTVSKGDSMELVTASESPLTIAQFYELLFAKEKDQHVLQQAVHNEALPLAKREKLQKWA
ncbi:MAG: MOSC domain-containing protein [Muricauda sp.]|jgi:MOSC domain-containing protein YiiM|nr:MOSC domain-containing protein [Allomuricauda sp.]MBO6533537.1 MOSC domain-containing protein [Allomuricauda sp.]MBO6590429.1 MOSC domain-containing protein [Allomuricauda sp.]MBO6620114.1 MOSC domain-containing protein [Allomuricauda sp.]MBO6645950.1 MOSC domain-containing protein [Allomuricauda sp.]MBO6748452.1 MOSC domain-containing protein [Allomuricauda sp.]